MAQKQVRQCRLTHALTAYDADDRESEAGTLGQELSNRAYGSYTSNRSHRNGIMDMVLGHSVIKIWMPNSEKIIIHDETPDIGTDSCMMGPHDGST